MAEVECDDLVSQAPPVKRIRLEDSKTDLSLEPRDKMEGLERNTDIASVEAISPQASEIPRTTSPPAFSIPGLGRLGSVPRTAMHSTKPKQPENVMVESGTLKRSFDDASCKDGLWQADDVMEAMESTQDQDISQDSSPPLAPASSHTTLIEAESPSRTHTKTEALTDSTEAGPLPGTGDDATTAANQGSNMRASENVSNAAEGSSDIAFDHAAPALMASDKLYPPKSEELAPSFTHSLETVLGQAVQSKQSESSATHAGGKRASTGTPTTVSTVAVSTNDNPEWEVDSSPIESLTGDSPSDDSSSQDDSDEENPYKLLSPEEQAKILMEGDGASDDEGGNKGAKGLSGQLRTKNEIPEEVIAKPDVIVTSEMKISELGAVEGIVEHTLLIKAKISGEYKVLDSGSVLCLSDRSVIGVISETLGQVQQPFYSVRFTNVADIVAAGLSVGTIVFYSEQHSKYIFTQSIKAFKGSDASNLHDEEVGDEEVEFSDDEAEMEHKRRLKQKRIGKRGGKNQQDGGHSHAHPLRQEAAVYDPSLGISYDDAEDGPYQPLSRPTGYVQSLGRSEAPLEGNNSRKPLSENNSNQSLYVRGRGDRGRGRDRGYRGRGTGRGRGNPSDTPQSRYPSTAGYSSPSSESREYPPALSNPNPMEMTYPLTPHSQSTIPSLGNYHSMTPISQYSPQQPHHPQMWPQYLAQSPVHSYQQPYQQHWHPPASGAYINPAFFQGNLSTPHPHPPPAQSHWNQYGQSGGYGNIYRADGGRR